MVSSNRKGGRDTGGRFAKGNGGRPRGARNRVTVAVEELPDGEVEALTRNAIELALDGDTTALRPCLERVAPPRKSRFVTCRAPEVRAAADVVGAISAIVGAVSRDELSPDGGDAVAALVERRRRAIETVDFEDRISRLEKFVEGDGRELRPETAKA